MNFSISKKMGRHWCPNGCGKSVHSISPRSLIDSYFCPRCKRKFSRAKMISEECLRSKAPYSRIGKSFKEAET